MLIGFSSFATAAIRWFQDGTVRRVLSDVLSGTGFIIFAYLINLYGRKAIAWTMVFAVETIFIGVLVVAYSAYSYYKN